MRYGLPYQGSKNGIAEWIVSELPSCEIFCDLFMGGGAVTHAAMLSGKWKQFICNDIDARLPELFVDCVYGKYTVENHPEWINREEFFRRKDEDAYIALVWSFGNNGKGYLYGVDIEQMKYIYHQVVYFDDLDALKPYGYILSRSDKKTIYERYLDYQRQIKKQTPQIQLEVVTRQTEIKSLQCLESLQRLQSLQCLQSLRSLRSLQSLQRYGCDFSDVPIPKGALIYCDIPYVDTNCGKYNGFDHERFYSWAYKQDNIFISEYKMPEDFIEVANISKTVLSAADGGNYFAKEKIFTNKRTYDKLSDYQKRIYEFNTTEQMTLFDMGFNLYQE